MDEVIELKREGLSIRAISRLTGYDRKTIKSPESGLHGHVTCWHLTLSAHGDDLTRSSSESVYEIIA